MMRTLICIYLLFKSATGQKFKIFDIRLASALVRSRLLFGDMVNLNAPDWQKMIANMTDEAPLPEAFIDWRWGIEQSIRSWWRRLWGKS